ncbi:uncharacterized protein LOC123683002 [Harmonia axyridis]|uniref:uncharacterized protein LOC123683002 n=1 Tax=Harmonia axyridis TaxID=115357 RepID=UPI001E2782C1|nr:uncharacterized protein LOC123683002 [Harmonia axyridis]
MSSSNTDSVLSVVVQQMMINKNIVDYEFDVDGGTSRSDGFLGDVIFFHVKYKNKIDYLVLKTGKTNENVRNLVDADTLYNREICMYTKVIPLLEEFAKIKNNTVLPTFIPNVVFHHKESLVMENLRKQNFHMWNRRKPMTLAHLELLYENYGIWHGVTMAFKNQKPEEFSKCISGWRDCRFRLNKTSGLSRHLKREFSEVMRRLADRNRSDLVDVYKSYIDKIDHVLYRRDLKKEDMLIISHGDTWCNNYLFRNELPAEESKPNRVYFLDFQLSRPESPGLEMSSILYNMGGKDSFNNTDRLLKIYHSKLSETLKRLGSDPEKLFTMDDLKRHWKRYAFFNVLHSFIYSRISLCDDDDAPDLNQMAENGVDFDGVFFFEMKNMDLFWDRVLEIFIHYGEMLKEPI